MQVREERVTTARLEFQARVCAKEDEITGARAAEAELVRKKVCGPLFLSSCKFIDGELERIFELVHGGRGCSPLCS